MQQKRVQVGNEIGHMLRTCCTSNLHGVSREGSRRRGGMVGRVFSLFLSGFPRGWIFKGSGLNLRSGIRGQTRIAKQPISVLFLSSPSSLCYNKLREGGEEKGVGGSRRWRNNGGCSAGGCTVACARARAEGACFPKYFTAVIGSWPRKFRQQFHLCRLSIVRANLARITLSTQSANDISSKARSNQ